MRYSPSISGRRNAVFAVCSATVHNTGYVNYADSQASKAKAIERQDDALRDRLPKLLIRLRAHYGAMLPRPWLERPACFYAFACELIGAIRGNEEVAQ